MIIDKLGLLSNAQAFTASAASTDYINLGDAKNYAAGEPVSFAFVVPTAFAGLTSVQISLQTDDNSSFSSAVSVVSTEAIPVASLTKGAKFFLTLPKTEKYVRAYYTVVGTGTAGAITAFPFIQSGIDFNTNPAAV